MERRPTAIQDFGYSPTNFAGAAKGEIGGLITRATEPASDAAKIDPMTLNDPLRASGTFALTKSTGGSGIFLGFFPSCRVSGVGRPTGSLGFYFDCEASGGRLLVQLITPRIRVAVRSSRRSCPAILPDADL